MPIRIGVLLCSLSLLFFLSTIPGFPKDINLKNYDLIRNGNFEQDYRSWSFLNCNPNPIAAKDGRFGMLMSGISSENGYLTFFQNIIIPTRLYSAAISYDYRVRQWGSNINQTADLRVIIGKSRGFDSADFDNMETQMITPIKSIKTNTVDSDGKWHQAAFKLDHTVISSIQAARENGYILFLQFILTRGGSETLDMNIHIDNLSMRIDGQQDVPNINGDIAFFNYDPQIRRNTIKLLDPNSNSSKTLWTYPKAHQKYHWKDIKWKPDGSELAFISDHETPFSPTYTDIYAIQPDGGGFRKISNPPFQKQIKKRKAYPRIKVTGRLKNKSTSENGDSQVIAINLWIQGARKVIPLKLTTNAKIPFEIDNVAVVGKNPDQFEPIVVLHWSTEKCAFGVEYERPVSDISFSKADIGTLIFDGLVCNETSEANSIRNLSWTRDGSSIGFSMIGSLRKIASKGQSVFASEELLSFSGVYWPDHMAWSPINNHYLFYNYDLPTMEKTGIYLVSEDGEPELLVNDARSISPVWLPDGSGFLYVKDSYEDKNIYHYHLQTKEIKRLTYFSYDAVENLSVADGGRYIVFELHNTWANPIESDLWIMDLFNPVDMWQLTDDGKSTHPDWRPGSNSNH